MNTPSYSAYVESHVCTDPQAHPAYIQPQLSSLITVDGKLFSVSSNVIRVWLINCASWCTDHSRR